MISHIVLFGHAYKAYYVFHVLGFIGAFLFNVLYCKKYDIKKLKAILMTVSAYAIMYIWIYVLSWIESGFSSWGDKNIVRGFVYLPLILIPICRIMKIKVKAACDFVAPCVCIAQGISHLGCACAGCCHGYACSWGIYNSVQNKVLFPVQIFESITAIAIFLFLIVYAKKTKFDTSGRVYPIFLILYGSTRFIWEFFRDNYKLFLNISALALHAVFMVVVGIVWLIIYKTKAKNLGR